MATNDSPFEDLFRKRKALPDLAEDGSPTGRMMLDRYVALRTWRKIDPKRNIHQASEHIDSLLKKIGMQAGMDEQKLIQAWSSIAGDFVAKHAQPASLKKGVLTLNVIQPAMRFHLEQMKGKLLVNLKKELGDDAVKIIRFQVG